MLRTREWARRYCDMLDGAEEAPTVNELYEAIDKDEEDLVEDAFVQADRYTEESLRDLRNEVNWLHSELHGAELEAERIVRCRDCKRFDSKREGCWWFTHYEQRSNYSWEEVPADVEPDGFCKWGEVRGA